MKIKQSARETLRFLVILMAVLLSGVALAAGSTESVIYSFPTYATGCPTGNLVEDSAGNLYGVAAECALSDPGAVFELTPPVAPARVWTERVLYAFTGGDDGDRPQAGLIFDGAGNLYGTTGGGGTAGVGTVFELSPPASEGGDWTETVLYSFKGGSDDGATPAASLAWDSSGNLYSTTQYGGVYKNYTPEGCGTVFQLAPPAVAGGAWTETVIHYFDGPSGFNPNTAPVLDAQGNIYGIASGGGKNVDGVAFTLTHPTSVGGAWSYRSSTTSSSPKLPSVASPSVAKQASSTARP
jgi:uncharacterized repeat protein (TIGR03803 family)